MLIKNVGAILPDRIAHGADVLVGGENIAAVGADLEPAGGSGPCEVLDGEGLYLSPGFIDLHMHIGYLGPDCSTQAELELCAENLPRNGTTRWIPTLITALSGNVPGIIEEIREFLRSGARGARPLGVHLEGPYISLESLGGFRPEQVTTPAVFSLGEILDAGSDFLRIVSLSPEVRGVCEVIRECSDRGIVVGMCHTKAGEEEYLRARAAGASHITHCYNNRRDFPDSPLGGRSFNLDDLGVADDGVTCELICDGHHVKPVWVKTIYRVKGPDRISLVTDSFLAGRRYEDGHTFRCGNGTPITIRNGVGRDEHGGLSGSTVTQDLALKRFLELSGCSLPEAVRCASLNPARVLGQDARFGSIEAGKVADLVLLDADLVPVAAIVAGAVVFDSR